MEMDIHHTHARVRAVAFELLKVWIALALYVGTVGNGIASRSRHSARLGDCGDSCCTASGASTTKARKVERPPIDRWIHQSVDRIIESINI